MNTVKHLDMSHQAQAERQRRVVELTRAGRSASDIAWILGIGERTVTRYRRRAGITRGVCRERTSEDLLLAAKEMLVDGVNYREVGRTLGVNRSTIAKHFPGYAWTREQVVEHRKLMQQFYRLQAALAVYR